MECLQTLRNTHSHNSKHATINTFVWADVRDYEANIQTNNGKHLSNRKL